MSSLTAGQLVNLRTDTPHEKKTYLSPVPHVPLLEALVNDLTITWEEESIVYDTGTGTAGEFALVEDGQTLLLGTTAGDDDLGRARVKSIAGNQVAGTITVAWNHDVNWQDGAYITILHMYECWPMFPRFTVGPENWWKDKDIDYTDENTDQYPVAIMGPGGPFTLVAGTYTADIDGSNSYAIASGATITGYAWTVATADAGAAPVIANAAIATTTITFDTAALHWVKLVVTDSNGKTQRTLRPFVIHDDSNLPYYVENVTRTLDWEAGGGKLSFTVSGSAPESSIQKRTPVYLWSDNVYAGASVNVSYLNADEYSERGHIDFFGYIDDITSSMSPAETGDVSFTAVTIDQVLRQKFEYPTPVIAHDGTINEWWKFPKNQLTVARALHFLWRWHSRLFDVADVHLPTGDTILRRGVEEFTQNDLYSRADEFARNKGIFAHIVSNKYGCLYAEIDIQMLDGADRAAVTDIFSLTSVDWGGDVQIILRERNEIAQAFISGGNWTGNSFTPLLSKWGEVANNDGSGVLVGDRLMCSSQADINMKCGRLVASQNHWIVELRYTMAGNWSSAMDIVPAEWVRTTLLGTEGGNHREVVLTNIRAKVIMMETQFNTGPGVSETKIVLQPEFEGRDGVDGDYPDDISYDDPEPPPWPSEPWGNRPAVIFDSVNGCYFNPEPGVFAWEARNTGLAGDALKMQMGIVPPGWWEYQVSSDPEDAIFYAVCESFIIRSLDAGKTWYDITPLDTPPDPWGFAPAPTASDLIYVSIDALDSENICVVAKYDAGGVYGAWLLFSTDMGDTWNVFEELSGGAGNYLAYYFVTTLEGWTTPGAGVISWDGGDGDPAVGCLKLDCQAIADGVDGPDESAAAITIVAGDGIRCKCKTDSVPNTTVSLFYHSVEFGGARNLLGAGASQLIQAADGWVDFEGTFFQGIGETFEHVDVTIGPSTGLNLWVDSVEVFTPGAGSTNFVPTGVNISKDGVSHYAVTGLRGTTLVSEVINAATLAIDEQEDLGTTNLANVTARTHWAYPECPNDPTQATYGDQIYVYGRFPDFGGAVTHLIFSDDAGATYNDIGDSPVWGANYQGGFLVEWAGQNMYAFVGTNLYASTDGGATWALTSVLPHNVELGVSPGYDTNETFLIAHLDAASPKVSMQGSPYSGVWTNISGALPATGLTRGAAWV